MVKKRSFIKEHARIIRPNKGYGAPGVTKSWDKHAHDGSRSIASIVKERRVLTIFINRFCIYVCTSDGTYLQFMRQVQRQAGTSSLENKIIEQIK